MTMDDSALNERLQELPEAPTANDYRSFARGLLPHIHEQVPPMGEGQSLNRLRFLTVVARHDLSLARLIEGHLDATQILREAQRPCDPSRLYGIWASGGPADTTTLGQSEPADRGRQAFGKQALLQRVRYRRPGPDLCVPERTTD